MKDVVLYEGITTKFISYFLQLYFICYKFSNFRNMYMYRCIDKEERFVVVFLLEHRWTPVQQKQGSTGAWCAPTSSAPVACGRRRKAWGCGQHEGRRTWRRSSSAARLEEWWCRRAWRSSARAASSRVLCPAEAERRGEPRTEAWRSGVEWLGTARTSRRASVLSGIWRQEDTVLLSQREKREKLYTNDEWAPQEFPFSDLTNMDSGFWPRKNI
jgi:hypothetical protein